MPTDSFYHSLSFITVKTIVELYEHKKSLKFLGDIGILAPPPARAPPGYFFTQFLPSKKTRLTKKQSHFLTHLGKKHNHKKTRLTKKQSVFLTKPAKNTD